MIAACLAISQPAVAQSPAPVKPDAPQRIARSKTPMMDILILELLKGEPINDTQAKELINKEFGRVWNNLDPYPIDPADSKEVREAKYHTWVYLAAIKASFLDTKQHGYWATGYGRLRAEGYPKLMLDQLKALAALPQDQLNRTIINYAMITPAWIAGDHEAMDRSDAQRAKDWPANSFVARNAAMIKERAERFYPKDKK